MISVVAIPSDYSNSTSALVALSSSSITALTSKLPQVLEVIPPQLAPALLSESPPLNAAGTDSSETAFPTSAVPTAIPASAPIPPPEAPAASPSSTPEAPAVGIPPQIAVPQSPLASVSSPSLQFVKAISSWSSGISESLKFDAPLVAVVENHNPRSLPLPTEVNDAKSLISVKGGGSATGRPEHEKRDCLAADEMLPKPTFEKIFQVQVKGQTIANLTTQEQSSVLAQQLEQTLKNPDFNPEMLQAKLDHLLPTGKAGETTLFQIDPALASQFDRNPELLAISWINNLRSALGVLPLPIAEAQSQMHMLTLTQKQLKGNASWYDPSFAGSLTATGETFDPVKLTAAHPTLPFGTYLKVTNQETHDSLIVRINDRGPYLKDRSLDLSGEAARCLNSEASGVVPYEAVVMENPQDHPAQSPAQSPAKKAQSSAPSTATDSHR